MVADKFPVRYADVFTESLRLELPCYECGLLVSVKYAMHDRIHYFFVSYINDNFLLGRRPFCSVHAEAAANLYLLDAVTDGVNVPR